MMAGGIWAQQSPPQSPAAQTTTVQKRDAAKKKKRSAKNEKKKTANAVPSAEQLPAQIMPPLPATLMNSAPVKPQVTMDRGLLTIDAPNSTLSDVLTGIHNVTGATIEGASPTERVAVKLGPGAPGQVLAALLRGTPYDYIILGSLGRQDVVTRVLLTQQSQSSGGESSPAEGAASRGAQEAPQDESMPERNPPEAAAPPTADSTPQPEADQAQQPPQQDPNQPKTPDQLFKELQQLDQQRQQQQK
jgi:hypothetical protein